MPQLQNLVVKDRSTPTPLDRTFIPRDIVNNVGTVVESTGTPIGDSRFTVNMRKTTNNRYKATIKGEFPVVQEQEINGVTVPVLARKSYVELTFSFDENSTLQERNDVVGMIANSLAADKVLINDLVVKLQGVY